jgi:hypothetical protein
MILLSRIAGFSMRVILNFPMSGPQRLEGSKDFRPQNISEGPKEIGGQAQARDRCDGGDRPIFPSGRPEGEFEGWSPAPSWWPCASQGFVLTGGRWDDSAEQRNRIGDSRKPRACAPARGSFLPRVLKVLRERAHVTLSDRPFTSFSMTGSSPANHCQT